MEKQYNIMTSCDDNLIPYLAIELTSIAYNLKAESIEFFLLHGGKVSQKNIDMLKALCNKLENGKIHFNDITVPHAEIYPELAKYGGGWVGEAYYSLCAYGLLPDDIDRVIYFDAGDILVLEDIEPYYTSDFNGNSLIVTGARFKNKNGNIMPFEQDDIINEEILPWILRGIFNSGSFVLNLEKMREDNLTLDYFQNLSLKLYEIADNKTDCRYIYKAVYELMARKNNKDRIYWGDQGLLSAAYVGDIQYYAYPDVKDELYIPYNFGLWYFGCVNKKPDYTPAVIHYCGGPFKPWKGNYPVFLERFQKKEDICSMDKLYFGQAEYYYIWHEYAIMTDEILKKLGF